MVLDRYEEWARKNAADSQLKYNVDKNQLLKSMILFPLTGAVVCYHHKHSLASLAPTHSSIPILSILENVSPLSPYSWAISCIKDISKLTMSVVTLATTMPTLRTFKG